MDTLIDTTTGAIVAGIAEPQPDYEAIATANSMLRHQNERLLRKLQAYHAIIETDERTTDEMKQDYAELNAVASQEREFIRETLDAMRGNFQMGVPRAAWDKLDHLIARMDAAARIK